MANTVEHKIHSTEETNEYIYIGLVQNENQTLIGENEVDGHLF